VNYKDADWLISDSFGSPPGRTVNAPDTVYEYTTSIWDNDKILRISTDAELQTFVQYDSDVMINGTPLLSSDLANVDFSEKTIFVFGLYYETQDKDKFTRQKIKIDKSAQEICLDFKLRTRVGGSGMARIFKYVYVIVPNEEADYRITGRFKVNERAGHGGGAHDFETEFEQ
jgi:hypothetical protein